MNLRTSPFHAPVISDSWFGPTPVDLQPASYFTDTLIHHLKEVRGAYDLYRSIPLYSHQVFVASDDEVRPG